jgi:23S rRNA pseudouridine2605 synthase
VCSKKDEHDRPTIYDLLPKEWQGVYSVGRLDYASEGLLFLTNDGEFALRLTHPRYGVRKRYVATVEGKVDDEMLRQFTTGVWHEGEKLKAERGWIISATKSASVVELELAEGKNREVRRLFESQGLTVKRLVRTMVGKIKLGELKVGRWRTLTQSEIKTLLS